MIQWSGQGVCDSVANDGLDKGVLVEVRLGIGRAVVQLKKCMF